MGKDRGIIYYNSGNKMAVRLAVSLSSLRKHYDGNICILSEGDDSHVFVEKFANKYDCQMIKTEYKTKKEKNATYLNACLTIDKTPFETTIWLDSDTIIRGDVTDLYKYAEESEFAIAQFADWKTSGKIGKRIKSWENIHPQWIKDALDFGPAINCGVFAFHKRSELMRDWWDAASKGQHLFIPDETCCQVMLPHYTHVIVDPKYNISCKYGRKLRYSKDARVVHYHGRKHCRFDDNGNPINASDLWYKEFEEIRNDKTVKAYISKDRQLRYHLKTWDKFKCQ
jgi:hypothetical protein